jgi:hypothetical protein
MIVEMMISLLAAGNHSHQPIDAPHLIQILGVETDFEVFESDRIGVGCSDRRPPIPRDDETILAGAVSRSDFDARIRPYLGQVGWRRIGGHAPINGMPAETIPVYTRTLEAHLTDVADCPAKLNICANDEDDVVRLTISMRSCFESPEQ